MRFWIGAAGVALTACSAPASAQTEPQTPIYGAHLERFDYPYPVHWFETRSQGDAVRMAYLDVAPRGAPNGDTVVLLHGKNFCAATWDQAIGVLAEAGYRVLAPDQIGFCKSSKPEGYQYSFRALASLTDALLDRVGAAKVTLVGHSTGGMLAMHYALLHPERLERLVLVNPLGLNDTVAEGVPYADLGTLRAEEAETDHASIKAYQQRVYYQGEWRPAYDRWVDMLAGQYASPEGDRVRDAQARLSDMIQSQPIVGQIPEIDVPTTLIIGQRDLTSFRRGSAPEAQRESIRTVPEAAETAVNRFPEARLIRLPELGHSPQIEAPEQFHRMLLAALASSD